MLIGLLHDSTASSSQTAPSHAPVKWRLPVRPMVVDNIPTEVEWCQHDVGHVISATLTSDASGSWGYGAYTSTGQWFQLKWPAAWLDIHITVKELLPIILGVALWSNEWAGKTTRCRCDNAAAVAAGRSKDDKMMHLLRSAFLFTAAYNITLVTEHIRGVQNGEADALSRDDHLSFLTQNPGACQVPVVIPQDLLEALVRQHPDWTSPSWARLLARGLADSTQWSYRSGQQRYLAFCEASKRVLAPESEETLVLFVSFLVKEGLKHRTIEVYLAAVRWLHIKGGRENQAPLRATRSKKGRSEQRRHLLTPLARSGVLPTPLPNLHSQGTVVTALWIGHTSGQVSR